MDILVTKKINASKESVWRHLSEFENIHKFHPLLKTSGYVEGSCDHTPGATRQCDMVDGSYLKERIVDWQENSHYSIEVYETSLPVSSSKATLGVNKIDSEHSIAYMHIQLKSKHALLTPFLYLAFRFYAGPAILSGLRKISETILFADSDFEMQTSS
ncbi:MAG: hypothetical protein CMB80_15550 [Flammeovirgaceae bacterium]|nr:hypothetical protein [Flammeovirgaceae bacterium]MBE62613.1 hypothetical protein [Flammeovirgaceae bacterium]HCX22632.1 hypothetical protein [Cytophagales bacterium]|tara:strand:+ start:1854 stop:2327 length:474 start_codon:yes stop_codon:yes gene_type:complete